MSAIQVALVIIIDLVLRLCLLLPDVLQVVPSILSGKLGMIMIQLCYVMDGQGVPKSVFKLACKLSPQILVGFLNILDWIGLMLKTLSSMLFYLPKNLVLVGT